MPVLISGILLSVQAAAQPGLDTTFNGTGIQTASFGVTASGSDLIIQPDRKTILVQNGATIATSRTNPFGYYSFPNV